MRSNSLRTLIYLLVLVIGFGFSSHAQTQQQINVMRAKFQDLRGQANTAKIAAYTRVMQLSEADTKKFWPLYRDYDKAESALMDKKLILICEYYVAQQAGPLTDEKAADFSKRWLICMQDRLDLWSKYHKKISKALSPVRGAQFLQIENQVTTVMDKMISNAMPIVGN